ncbi:MAG: hypothetical protein Q8L05_00735 [Actinomycetota bacterium]|nr:hypothetical protein [Actinomycetota bacterium]MDP2287180.1 hypothetical protein [Actinomycetota bacterium]
MLSKLPHRWRKSLSPMRHWARGLRSRSGDRGDVPGWVLVAVMTAGLVTAIWLVADDALTSVFDRAMSSISGHS